MNRSLEPLDTSHVRGAPSDSTARDLLHRVTAPQVMWNRLIAIVEEQALTLVRTAFSTSVREAGDLSAGVFDPIGTGIREWPC